MLDDTATEDKPEALDLPPSAIKPLSEARLDAEGLFRRYAASPEPRLRDKLVSLHVNLVRYLAGKFASRGEPLEDLIQVGTIGLINAIDRFDPSRGIKFSTYATPTIVGEIRRYFRDKAWSLKVPRRLQELSLSTAKARDVLTSELGRAPTVTELSKRVDADEEEVLQALEIGVAYDTVSLDSQVQQESDSSNGSLADLIGSEDPAILKIDEYGDLEHAMTCLDQRELGVIICRYFREMSQADVAALLHISQMHVSRLQKHALKKLKRAIEKSP